MPRTNTTSYSFFTRPGAVTYTFHAAPKTTITLPPKSDWTSGLHWHETHTEFLQVVSGRALVTLNGSTRVYGEEHGIITVPRYARHEWKRAESDGDEAIVEEWTDPADGEKEVFFRNLSSVIIDETRKWNGKPSFLEDFWLTWKLWVVFWGLDNFPVVWGYGGWIQWFVTHAALWVAMVAGRFLGFKSRYHEYTPSTLGVKKCL